MASDGAETSEAAPAHLCCPITQQVFEDPVVDVNGHTFERRAITRWIVQQGKSPITNQRYRGEPLRDNFAVRAAVEAWQEMCRRQANKREAAAAARSAAPATTATAPLTASYHCMLCEVAAHLCSWYSVPRQAGRVPAERSLWIAPVILLGLLLGAAAQVVGSVAFVAGGFVPVALAAAFTATEMPLLGAHAVFLAASLALGVVLPVECVANVAQTVLCGVLGGWCASGSGSSQATVLVGVAVHVHVAAVVAGSFLRENAVSPVAGSVAAVLVALVLRREIVVLQGPHPCPRVQSAALATMLAATFGDALGAMLGQDDAFAYCAGTAALALFAAVVRRIAAAARDDS